MFEDFNNSNLNATQWEENKRQPGTDVVFLPDASEVQLVFPAGAKEATPSGCAGIATTDYLHYGYYSCRMKVARCEPDAELVNSFFTYFHDKNNPDENNSEIDIEILGSEPETIYLTIWTHADSATGRQKRVTRVIDMQAGRYKQSELTADGFFLRDDLTKPPPFPITGDIPRAVPGFDASRSFYEYRFEWRADKIVYEIKIDGQWMTLWDFRVSAAIPKQPATLRANIWWTSVHWKNPDAAVAPAQETRHTFDWMYYHQNSPDHQ